MLRINKEATKQAGFRDPWSYVSFRVHPGMEHACVYLFGEDRGERRAEVRFHYRGRCVDCGIYCWIRGEMDHVEGGLGPQRCDCYENLRWRCGPSANNCHAKKHRRITRFGEATA